MGTQHHLFPPLPAAGIDFAGVHDSFWTHAGTVERMNELLRDKFVELHSQVGNGWGVVGQGHAVKDRLPDRLHWQPHCP